MTTRQEQVDMGVFLAVLVSGVWYPTWGWAMDDRYDPRYHFVAPQEDAGRGISAWQACNKQKQIMKEKHPQLKFSCQETL